MSNDTVCKRFIVSGRVQGVFFRASTAREADRLGLSGVANNLPDGTVERSLAVLRIDRNDSFTVASPASSTFVTVATE